MPLGAAAAVAPLNRLPSRLSRSRLSTMASSVSSAGVVYTTLREQVRCEREIKRSKFIAVAASVSDHSSALSFLSEVKDHRATHNCWAYKIGDEYRCNDDGEPSGTAGKPIYSALALSGIDRVMVVVIRHFGGIKLGTGGLARAYGGITSDCLKDAPTCLVKSKIQMGLEIPFDLLGSVYHQLQTFQVDDIKQDYDLCKEGFTMVTFKVDYDLVDSLETSLNANCGRKFTFYK